MTQARWQRVATFYGLALAGAVICGLLAGWARTTLGSAGATVVLVGMMFVPTLAATITQRLSGEPVLSALGVRLSPNRWWLVAWLAPAALALASLGISLALPGVSLSAGAEGLLEQLAETLPPEQLQEAEAQLTSLGPWLLPVALLGGLLGGATINAVAALGEEAGWRGWLHAELAPLGFWRASLLTGVLWGLWHAPVILQGHNYPDHPVIGVAMMAVVCAAISPPMALIRDRAGSSIAAALFHGVFNGTAGLPLMFVVGGSDLLIGVTGAAGVIVYGAVCAWIAIARPEGTATPR